MAAEKKGGSKPAAKGKKPGKSLSSLYTISGEKIERKNRSCPKCGQGTFMGKHSNRLVCGKCRYVEMVGKK
ncbi:30S ribosomal protein S27ae [Candidatus Woesearchaeota archaeon]|nr:30S ribosomal protein S27ae [Candidatus Woesearchaeota archaeon]